MEQNHNSETPAEHSNQIDPQDNNQQGEIKYSEFSPPENPQESHLESETPLIEEANSSLPPDYKSSETNTEPHEIGSVPVEESFPHVTEPEPENQPLISEEPKFVHHSSPKVEEVKIESEPITEMKLEEPTEVIHTIANDHKEPQTLERPYETDSYMPSEQKSNEQSIETFEQHPSENKHDEEVKDNYDNKFDDDQPVIVDETHLGIPSEREPHDIPINADRVFETNVRERQEEDNEEMHGEGQNDPNNERDQALDNEFYQHSLQYLVQNLNNLRDTLQTILTNSELTQEIQGNNVNRNNQQFIQNEGMNANNEDQLQDQLMNIRRLLAGSLENNNAQNNAYGWDNEWQNRLNLNNQQQQEVNNEPNRLENWGRRIETYARQVYTALPKDLNTLSWLIFIVTAIFLAFCYTTIPEIPRENPGYFIDWLASHKDARLLLFASGLFYLCAVFKFNQVLHTTFVSEAGEDYYKSFFTLMSKYSPFYDLGLYIFIDRTIAEDKLEYFVVTGLLVWYTVSTKLVGLQHQKLNQAAASIHNNTDQNLAKMKRIQWVSAIYLILNCQIAYTIIWVAFYASYLTIFVISALSLLAITEPLKVFLSSTILVKNYSLVSNNNTRELSDPKFKIELLIDLINQFTILLLIVILSISYAQQVTGFVAVYWLSFTNAIEKLKNSYNKYSNWLKLQKRLDEIFPIVERSEEDPEEMCSICHENLLIARKLPCGHIFHLKCLIYWLDNQKTCPNCRANMANLNEIMGNNRPEGTISRVFSQLTAPFRTLFNRAA